MRWIAPGEPSLVRYPAVSIDVADGTICGGAIDVLVTCA